MGDRSAIGWTDATWNPVTGCSKVSQGCKNCYAERVFPRAYGPKNEMWSDGEDSMRPRRFTDVATHPERLEQPLHWKKPRRIFVNSMSDLFHEAVPDDFIHEVWGIMRRTPQHTYQILTKRAERMANTVTRFSRQEAMGYASGFYSHVHLGVSIEDQPTADERIPWLLKTPAAVRFVSAEPLLGPISFRWASWHNYLHADNKNEYDGFNGLHWIIVGGESGPKARPFNVQWARDIIAQCKAAGVACFIKQMGKNPTTPELTHWKAPSKLLPDSSGYNLKLNDSHGGDWNEWPEDLRVREFPARR